MPLSKAPRSLPARSFLLLLAIGGVAASAAPAFATTIEPPPARVTGRVAAEGVTAVTLETGPAPISDGWSVRTNPEALTVPLDAQGAFEAVLPVADSGFYRLTAAGKTVELFVTRSAVLEVAIDPAAGGVTFTGDLATENRYLAELAERLAATERTVNATYRTLFALAPEAFAERLAELEAPVRERNAAFVEAHPTMAPAFGTRIRGEADAFFGLFRLVYPALHHELTGNVAAVGPDYYEKVGRDLLRRGSLLGSARYVAFLDTWVDIQAAGAPLTTRRGPREKLHSRYDAIRVLPTPPAVRDHLLAEMFHAFQTSYGPADWGPVFERFAADQPGHPLVAAIRPDLAAAMAERERPDAVRIFRSLDGVELEAHLFEPSDREPGERRAAYLFFHGGGWAIGTPEWGYNGCERMASRGMVAISFEYRLADVHGTGIFTAVDDVQHAIAWARQHAAELGIDPERVVAAGFSAGGHLAAAAAVVPAAETLGASARPDALILHSASYDLTKGAFFEAMTGGRAAEVSLQHRVSAGLPPALLLHGGRDHLAPRPEFQAFVARMEALENDFEAHLFDEVGHFFRDDEARAEVVRLVDAFLRERGFLEGGG